MTPQFYLLIKALHVFVAILFVSGLVTICLLLSGARAGASTLRESSDVLEKISIWNGRITTPALLATWVLGLSLAYMGGFIMQPWLAAKLIAVLILSALHGVGMGLLRRMRFSATPGPRVSGFWLLAFSIFLLFVICLLAVIKPM